MSLLPLADEPKQHYYPNSRPRLSSCSLAPGVNPTISSEPSPSHFPSHRELLPILVSQQSSIYKDRLLQYNKLVSAGRGGGGSKTHTPPLPTVTLPSPHAQPTTRSRSSSKVSNKGNAQTKLGSQNGHGNRTSKPTDNADRALLIPKKEQPPKMSGSRHPEQSAGHSALPSRPRPAPSSQQPSPPAPTHSSSVPSTPHQHPRRFPDEEREPSPGATQNHSPRSAYSETNGNAPTLRRLPAPGYCRFETDVPRPRRRMAYALGSERLEKVDLTRVPNRLSEQDEDRLAKDIGELYKQLLPTEEVEMKRKKLVHKLEKLLNDEWPGHDIQVHLFGSSGNLLCSDDSDVDICITTRWRELENVCLIADLLSRQGMEKVICVKAAKIPIVKIWDPELKLACDMNVNNTLALENTRMVRTYVEIDERVRPLAMIIKYWTRRRVVNVPAFGGTLSSYTWICMIIAFLQLREPPVLPALHQKHDQKLIKADGTLSEFADDLDKLKGFGDSNNESLAALLFHFFRFYAHEFDFEKDVLSVRLGRTVTKVEKNWQFGGNNALCVEEPFNTNRNLGNTADDISFRGLHLELRRAFELLSAGNFEECCEEYIFPKEEIQQAPKPQTSRPIAVVPIRSASQQHGNRGGRGSLRGGGNRQYRNGNSSRRASSSVVHDPNSGYSQSIPVTMNTVSPELLWFQPQNSQLGVQGSQLGVTHPQDIFTSSLNALAAQETSLRFQLYNQAQQLNQQQALAHVQRMQGNSTQSAERPRGNSFDNPPLTAPIRPDLVYGYPFPIQHSAYFHPGITTYPTSPAASSTPTNGTSDFRRSLHRNSVANDATSAGGGPLRSQSQPASRSSLNASQLSAYGGLTQSPSSMPARQLNGMVAPSFLPDELTEPDFDDAPIKPLSESPTEDEGPRIVGYIVPDNTSPVRKVQQGFPGPVPTLGEASQNGQGRRRLSTDQSPQSILDRRMKRTSRSPSPLGHARAFSTGTSSTPLASATFQQANGKLTPNRAAPLVVNGSVAQPPPAPSAPRQVAMNDNLAPDDASFDNALHISQGVSTNGPHAEQASVYQPTTATSSSVNERPLVVDGSSTSRSPLPPQIIPDPYAHMLGPGFAPSNYQYPTMMLGAHGLPGYPAPPVARVNGHLASLDLATDSRNYMVTPDNNLSPVYENRTPSPTVVRRFEGPNGSPMTYLSKEGRSEQARSSQKTPPTRSPPVGPSGKHDSGNGSPVADSRGSSVSRESGQHSRNTKGQGDNYSWHRPKSRKRGVPDFKQGASGSPPGEHFPKNDTERKGG
ncbi:hypothetical protein V8F20_004653 [Naviculisporaceae sp. PSN 640]